MILAGGVGRIRTNLKLDIGILILESQDTFNPIYKGGSDKNLWFIPTLSYSVSLFTLDLFLLIFYPSSYYSFLFIVIFSTQTSYCRPKGFDYKGWFLECAKIIITVNIYERKTLIFYSLHFVNRIVSCS